MFFTQMHQLITEGVDYNLTLRKNENGMTVLVMPRMNDLKDAAQHHLAPLTLSGPAEELDRHFMSAITQPVQRAAGLLSSMAQFERQADKAAAESKAAKEQKDKESKEAKEKREKYEKFIKKSEDLEEAKNYAGAIDSLRQARLHATEQSAKSVDEKIAALRATMNGGTLFGTSLAEPAPRPQPQFIAPETTQPNPNPRSAEQLLQPAYTDPFGQIPTPGAFREISSDRVSGAHYSEQTGIGQQYMREHPPMNFAMPGDRSACRDDEYSGYPDFPRELAAQPMYNPQNY